MRLRALALALPMVLFFSTCAAYKAQHANTEPKAARASSNNAASEPAAEKVKLDPTVVASFDAQPIATKQALLLSQIDTYREELKANGKYDCCVKPACRQCALTAGECHCRQVIDANGPCCGECTQSWVEGRGNTAGVDREKVLEHLGCVRELYEKKTPDGITPPAQTKKN
ncbi:MAG TPA: hypothetical protein VJZ00_08010 [Thermoanaerobaculia bacterium]|nr:hypothetical protein [Thermoanaerobaculia bacterium]